MDAGVAEVLRLALISLDESPWPARIAANCQRPNATERPCNGVWRIMKAEKITLPDYPVSQPDASYNEADFSELMCGIAYGNGTVGSRPGKIPPSLCLSDFSACNCLRPFTR